MQENNGSKEEGERYIMAQIRYPSWQKTEEKGQNSNFTSNWQAVSLRDRGGSNAATLQGFFIRWVRCKPGRKRLWVAAADLLVVCP